MTEKIILSKKAKESLKKVFGLVFLPVYTMLIYFPFSDLYLAVFGNAAKLRGKCVLA